MDFTPLKEYLHGLQETWKVPGCAMTVRVGRETVFEDYENAAVSDVYWIYSATKVFTAVAFCRLLEQGKLHLEDKAADYFPEYAHLEVADEQGNRHTAREPLTLLHLITMCGGLTYNIMDPLISGAKDRTTRGILREIAKMPLMAEPGETYNYSLCHDVIAGIVEQVAGVRFDELVYREISEPLGMKSTFFHPDEALQAKFAPQYFWKGEENNVVPCPTANHFCFSPDYDSGGAGLCSTLEDYILLAEALANGGRGRDGYPLLRPETIDAMRKNYLTASQKQGFDLRWGARHRSYGYGLGVRTRIDHEDGGLSPLGEFGWDGAAGAYCLVDPENQISAFYIQHVLNMGPVYDVIHPTLRNLVYQCLEK